ncbi:radical SAM mobile pair protein B [uncultured Brachyspira sp.]|uniref:radical SAM mobile pair protein B n=1 Tax=uncultured Brachyspira sp. TaxID=221953 RepID=UPI0025F67F67|nr:radical SAM mobile pair protein B [uncultured Brachyspira sp.]
MKIIIKKIKTKNVITKSNLPVCDFSVNTYIGCTHSCKYCYASFMKRFTKHNEMWGEFIDVKIWDKIKKTKKYAGKELFVGSVTDPYNPQEEIYERTRTLLTELQGSGVKLSIATKSDLILRDLDIIKTFPNARISFSINTLDKTFKNDMDKAVSIDRRLAAMKKFYKAGIRTICFISPIFPGITDVKAIIECVKNQCNLIWLENLNLRGEYKAVIMDYIKEKYPALMPMYYEIYNRDNRIYWEALDIELKEYAAEIGLDYVTNDDSINHPFDDLPVIVNYFYHSKIKKSAVKIQ